MNEQACRVCGCTERFGCEEGCHWVEPDLCSVCAGVTKMHRRSYTRRTPDTEPALMPPLQIHNPVGRLVGLAWHISEAQAMARGIDAYYKALNKHADLVQGRKRWRRGPLVRRPRPGEIIDLTGDHS